MEMISFCYKRIFFLKVAKFKYLLTKFWVQNDFPFGARGNGSKVSFFFCDTLSVTHVVKASASQSKGREFYSWCLHF